MATRWKLMLSLGAGTVIVTSGLVTTEAPSNGALFYFPDSIAVGCAVIATLVGVGLVVWSADQGLLRRMATTVAAMACMFVSVVGGGLLIDARTALTSGPMGLTLLLTGGVAIVGCLAAIDRGTRMLARPRSAPVLQ